MRKRIKRLIYMLSKRRDEIAWRLEQHYDPYWDGFFDGLALICDKLAKIILRGK